MTITTPDVPVSEKWPVPPPRPALVWGEWVTHHDTAGAVAGMSTTPDPSGLTVTTTFSAFEKQLDGDGPLATTISLAGHLPLTLPLGIPLAGFRTIAQGAVERSPATSVLVTLTVGGEVCTARWDPVPVRHDPDNNTDNDPDNDPGSDPARPLTTGESPFGGQLALSSDVNLGCISPDRQVVRTSSVDGSVDGGDVADPFPPLPLQVDLHLRRQTTDESIYVNIASLDISVLLDL